MLPPFFLQGGGSPKTEVHFAYTRQKKTKEKKVGASSKNFYDRYTSFRASFSLYHTLINWTRSLPVGIADYDNHVRVYGILDAMVLMIIKGCLSFKCLQPLVSNKDCSGGYVYDKVNDFSELTLHHSRPGLT